MKQTFEEQYHLLEKDHWWFKGRRDFIIDLVKDFPKDSVILDIGCSTGILLKELEAAGFDGKNLFGIDISEKAIEGCIKRGLENCMVMNAQKINFSQKFDIIIASDCLEHLQNDRKALENWRGLLKSNGNAIIIVPAFKFLWSRHDEVNHHFRRYTNINLRKKMTEAGFKISGHGYWNFSLFFPLVVRRSIISALDKKDVHGDLSTPPKIINSFLKGLLQFENRLSRKLRFPIGVSTYCLGKP